MSHINLKTEEELRIMQDAGRRLRRVMKRLLPAVTVGKTTREVDRMADALIKQVGGEPGFKRVKGYKWATCLPVNEQAVHTPPSERRLKAEDLLTIDIGLYLQGFHTDHAISMIVGGTQDPKKEAFLAAGRRALSRGIKAATAGNYVGDISKALHDEISSSGYRILKPLTGHGIGRQLHEAPMVPGFVDRPRERTLKLEPGTALAIEVIYSESSEEIEYEDRKKWSIISADRSLAACFEHTIAIFSKLPVILT